MPLAPELKMSNGHTIPQVGWGTLQIDSAEMSDRFAVAAAAGYRHIDTAQAYGNEDGVGAAVQASDVPREQIFVTTKLANEQQGYDQTMRAFDVSMKKLKLDVLDLFLIHWPQPMYDQYIETWKAFEVLLGSGRVASIGVSNFTQSTLERLFNETSVVPVVNQIELHPRFPQTELRAFHAQHRILTEAWSPLERGGARWTLPGNEEKISLLDEPVIVNLAAAKNKSAAQVVLRWHIQLGNVVLPKTVNPDRLRENIDIFDFELTADEMAQMATLASDRMGPDPQHMAERG